MDSKLLMIEMLHTRQLFIQQHPPNWHPTKYSMPILQPRPASTSECVSRWGWPMNPVLFLGRPGLYYINP